MRLPGRKKDPEITALRAGLVESERADLADLEAEIARSREAQRDCPDPDPAAVAAYERDVQANIGICQANIRDLSPRSAP